MPKPRQPTSVLKERGKKHLTRAEIAERERKEVKLLPEGGKKKAVRICYPPSLPESMKPRFREYALQLIGLGIYLNAPASGDADMLRDYMIFQQSYLNEMALKQKATKAAAQASDEDEKAAAMAEVKQWSTQAQKDFTMAKAAAFSIGLTVSARCHLIIPQAKDPDQDDEMDDLLGGDELMKYRRAANG